VVPVKMGDEDVGANGLPRGVALELLSQGAQSGAAIEDIKVVADAHFDAGGVPSVAQVVGLGSWRGSTHTPELNPHTPPWQICADSPSSNGCALTSIHSLVTPDWDWGRMEDGRLARRT
jgi:hypothetical protein